MEEFHEDSSIYHATIDASPGHVLATLRNLKAYPEWQDDITAVDVIDSDPLGLPSEARLTFNSMGMEMTLKLALVHGEQTMSWSLLEGAFITRNDAEFVVAALADDRTELTLRQYLELKWRMPKSLIRYMVERTVNATIDAVKERAEKTARSQES